MGGRRVRRADGFKKQVGGRDCLGRNSKRRERSVGKFTERARPGAGRKKGAYKYRHWGLEFKRSLMLYRDEGTRRERALAGPHNQGDHAPDAKRGCEKGSKKEFATGKKKELRDEGWQKTSLARLGAWSKKGGTLERP